MKRVSMKKPQAPPPQPPKEGAGDGGPPGPEAPSTLPRIKPKPPARKRQDVMSFPEAVSVAVSSLPGNKDAGVFEDDECQSPPLPNLPPPPLPDELEHSMGAALTSELHHSQNNNNSNVTDDESEVTCL